MVGKTSFLASPFSNYPLLAPYSPALQITVAFSRSLFRVLPTLFLLNRTPAPSGSPCDECPLIFQDRVHASLSKWSLPSLSQVHPQLPVAHCVPIVFSTDVQPFQHLIPLNVLKAKATSYSSYVLASHKTLKMGGLLNNFWLNEWGWNNSLDILYNINPSPCLLLY